jgi:serine/threonine protein kinase
LTETVAQYRLVKTIGEGHFGTVYLADGEVPSRNPHSRSSSRRIVAIKKLNQPDPESVRLLLREFSLLQQVNHRCIVQVYEYLEKDNAVVMEYIHGVTLRQVIEDIREKKERIFTEAAVEIGCELADALFQAYTTPSDNGEALQIVHRDLKPANLILTPGGELKILDFGLARVDNSDYTAESSDQVRGTPIYMAPEQAQGIREDHRTDLFALGLILYELLMGKPAYRIPYNSSDPVREIFQDISAGRFGFEFGRLEKELPSIGPILTRVLQKRPKDRYPNGQEMLLDLRRQLMRERGEYLKDFASFYFDVINPIQPMPTVESVQEATAGPSASLASRLRSARGKRSSPEQSQSQPRSAPAKMVPPFQPPKNREPSGPPPAKNTGVRMSNSKRPPVGGGASRSNPTSSGARGSGNARSPSETGMLQYVPLSDENAAEDDNNSTQFFAIPAPKQGQSRGPASPMPPAAMNAPPPPPPPPMPSGMATGGIGIGGVSRIGTGPAPVIGSGARSPVAVASIDTSSAVETEISGRAGSQRVAIILVGATLLLSIALVLTVWFMRPQEEVPASTGQTLGATPPVVYSTLSDDDEEEEEEEVVVVTKKRKSPSRSGQARKKKPKAAPSSGGKLTVSVTGTTVTSLELNCPGERLRARVSGGKGSFDKVPNASCTLFFKPSPAKYGPAKISGNLRCNISGGGAIVDCK